MRQGGWKTWGIITALIIVAAAIFLYLEKPPRAVGMEPADVLAQGRKAFSEFVPVGRQRVTIYRNGEIVKKEEIPSPLLPEHFKKLEGRFPSLPFALHTIHQALSEQAANLDLGKDFIQHSEVKINGARRVAGRWTWELEIHPKHIHGGYIRVFFDKETGYPLKRIKYDRNGQKVNMIELVRLDKLQSRPDKSPFGRPPPLTRDNAPFGPPGDGLMDRRGGMGPGFKGPPFERDAHGQNHPPPGAPFGPPGGPNRPGFPPGPRPILTPEEIREHIAQGRLLFPTYIPEGYHFVGARPMPIGQARKINKVQLILTDGINPISIFQMHLPQESLKGYNTDEYLREKARELQNSFPEGFAIKRVEKGLIVGVGDVDPDIIWKVIDSMTFFHGDKPVEKEIILNPEGLF